MFDHAMRKLAIGAMVLAVAATAAALTMHRSLRTARARVGALQSMLLAANAELERVQATPRPAAPVRPDLPAFEPPALPPLPVPEPAVIADHALEAELAQRDRQIARLQEQLEALHQVQAQRDGPREAVANRMQAWQERMREQDPEAYERRQREGRERLDTLSAMTSDRLSFMKSIRTDGLAPEYLENHQALLGRLEFLDHAMARLAADPESPETMALMPQMFQNLRGMDDMLAMQREVLLDDLARDLGYDERDARDFVETISYITEVTTMPTPGFLRRGGRGRMPVAP